MPDNWDRQPQFRAGFLRVYINGVSTLDLPIEATQSGEYTIPNRNRYRREHE